jgi:hypothetical protein
MAQDDALRPQRAQRDAGVFERFALFDGGGLGTDQRRVRAQTLGRQLERGPGAGAGFVEEECDPAMGQPQGARQRALRLRAAWPGAGWRRHLPPQRGDGEQRPRTHGAVGLAALALQEAKREVAPVWL